MTILCVQRIETRNDWELYEFTFPPKSHRYVWVHMGVWPLNLFKAEEIHTTLTKTLDGALQEMNDREERLARGQASPSCTL